MGTTEVFSSALAPRLMRQIAVAMLITGWECFIVYPYFGLHALPRSKHSVNLFHPHLTSPSRGREREETSLPGGGKGKKPPFQGEELLSHLPSWERSEESQPSIGAEIPHFVQDDVKGG